MEQIELKRFEETGKLGSGADYEVRSAIDLETGLQVVLKRPMPQMITRQMHWSTEARTDRVLQVRQNMSKRVPGLVPVLGYTEMANHDDFFGDALGQEYRVTVEERASGIPLYVGDPRAKITGVPVGAAQNLFALFPLAEGVYEEAHPIHRQLLDVQEIFLESGYILFDLGPQNIFFQPGSGKITVIDCAALVDQNGEQDPRGRPPKDIHDFYLEVLKYYSTPSTPPTEVGGYRDGYGLRPVINFQQELDEMTRNYGSIGDLESSSEACRDSALNLIDNVRQRAYANMDAFRRDLMAHLDAVVKRNAELRDIEESRQAWNEALGWFRDDYWRRFMFNPDTEFAGFGQK
ncbi:MAG: hypothetical protein BZY81_03515 [SAR202 cluster bacterium Io17-Chloro-G4]|nr:MAG: hypothetical protein BZY81_03515 [SAR202 cluster bacterium Io17-Chloro-G4]